MIYFGSDTTRRLVGRFHESLFGGGVLFLGHSETLWGISEAFRLEEQEKIFYYRKPRAEVCPPRLAAAPRSSGSSDPRRRGFRADPPPPHSVADSSPAMKLVLSAERLADEGRIEDAVAICRQAAALDPGCPEAEYLTAFLLRGHGRNAEALYHAERALVRKRRSASAGWGGPGRRRCGGRGSCAPSRETFISRVFRSGRGSPRRCCANTSSPDCRDESLGESRCGGPFPLR
jgi:hypothetical protein